MHQSKIAQIKSSPHYHESNGLTERGLQAVKRMWDKDMDKNLALSMDRNTHLESGRSLLVLLLLIVIVMLSV